MQARGHEWMTLYFVKAQIMLYKIVMDDYRSIMGDLYSRFLHLILYQFAYPSY